MLSLTARLVTEEGRLPGLPQSVRRPLIPDHFSVLIGNRDALQLELIVDP